MPNIGPFIWLFCSIQGCATNPALGWYLRYSLSYRDVEEFVIERGLPADHTTIWRWVQRYAPELNKRCRRELKPTINGSLQTRRRNSVPKTPRHK